MSSIKCGNCTGTHGSVSDVKECYRTPLTSADRASLRVQHLRAEQVRVDVADALAGAARADAAYQTFTAARDAEAEMHRMEAEGDLAESRRDSAAKAAKWEWEASPEALRAAAPQPGDMSYDAAEQAAEEWTTVAERGGKPSIQVRSTYRPGTSAPISTLEKAVPAGRYAVEEGGVLKFFVVDKPTEGRWAGYTFIKIQASDDTFPVKDRARRVVILTAIAQDPAAASARYGHELGCCGVCGRTLTDEESRARGIGPVCAAKMGW